METRIIEARYTLPDLFVMLLETNAPFPEIEKFTQELPIQDALELSALIYYGRECICDQEDDYSYFIEECSDDPRDWMRHAIDTKSNEVLIKYIKLGVEALREESETT